AGCQNGTAADPGNTAGKEEHPVVEPLLQPFPVCGQMLRDLAAVRESKQNDVHERALLLVVGTATSCTPIGWRADLDRRRSLTDRQTSTTCGAASASEPACALVMSAAVALRERSAISAATARKMAEASSAARNPLVSASGCEAPDAR